MKSYQLVQASSHSYKPVLISRSNEVPTLLPALAADVAHKRRTDFPRGTVGTFDQTFIKSTHLFWDKKKETVEIQLQKEACTCHQSDQPLTGQHLLPRRDYVKCGSQIVPTQGVVLCFLPGHGLSVSSEDGPSQF